jgi:hypothetical protein
MRPTASHASFSTQAEPQTLAGPSQVAAAAGGHRRLGSGFVASMQLAGDEGPGTGEGGSGGLGLGVQRLGMRLESRSDLRRLVHVLEQRLEKVMQRSFHLMILSQREFPPPAAHTRRHQATWQALQGRWTS